MLSTAVKREGQSAPDAKRQPSLWPWSAASHSHHWVRRIGLCRSYLLLYDKSFALQPMGLQDFVTLDDWAVLGGASRPGENSGGRRDLGASLPNLAYEVPQVSLVADKSPRMRAFVCEAHSQRTSYLIQDT